MSIEVAIKQSFPNMFRPLKWMHFDSPTEYGKGEWFAHGARGTFYIYDVREKFPNDRPFYAKEISDQFDTLEQAQAACQARNEGDILIGLSPDFISEIDRLKRENDELRLLLVPFAEEAENWSDSVPDDHKTLCTEPGSSTALPGSEASFTVGDLRRARLALASTGGEHHAE